MKLLRRLLFGLRTLVRKDREELELDDELSAYLEAATEEKVSRGFSRDEAMRAARIEMGSLAAVKEQIRDAGWESILEAFCQDVRFAIRTLRASRSFTAIAVLTLALGIGANTAIFSVINGVLLRPLHFDRSSRLVFIHEYVKNFGEMSVSYPNFADWREQNRVFEKIGVFNRGSYNLTGSGEVEQLRAGQMSSDLFDVLRVKAKLGRTYDNEEDRPGANPVVVLSYGLWQRRFGGDASIIGRSLTLNGRNYSVVGVMPQEFQFPSNVEMWVPAGALSDQDQWRRRGSHPGLIAVARLKDGVTLAQARQDMELVTVALAKQYPDSNAANRATMSLMLEEAVRNIRRTLYVLLGAVAFVLLIACANVASLMLGRVSSRLKEVALRTALGASRWRIVRQFLTEGVVIATLGGALALVLARWGIEAILAITPAGAIPRASEIHLDWHVLFFTAALSIATAFVFALAPALQASHSPVEEALKEASRSTTSSRRWLRNAVVMAEIALTLVLLVGAGLMIRSFFRLQHVNPGFSTESTLSFAVSLPEQTYPDIAMDRRIDFFSQLKTRIQTLPGVQSVGLSSGLPLGHNSSTWSFSIAGQPETLQQIPSMEFCVADAGYFETMRIPLVRGRWFNEHDDRSHVDPDSLRGMPKLALFLAGMRSIIIDEEFARRHFHNEDPIGKQIVLEGKIALNIVGVAGRVNMDGLRNNSELVQGYFPYLQVPNNAMVVTVRTQLPPENMIAAIRQQVQAIDPNLPIFDIRTLEQIREQLIAPERLNLTLLGIFAAIALVLALVGLFGVISWSVTQRTREIGVRIALGACSRDVLRLIFQQGTRVIAIGIGIGLVSAVLLTRLMTTLLFEVSATDPLTFVATVLLLVAVAVLACWIPARRATRVNPIVALRYD